MVLRYFIKFHRRLEDLVLIKLPDISRLYLTKGNKTIYYFKAFLLGN